MLAYWTSNFKSTITSSLNALDLVVNLMTGGDYGFLTNHSLVGDHGSLITIQSLRYS